MKTCFLLALSIFCATWCGPLHAQPPYKEGQYVTITNGAAPNHRFSLAAHGDGANGTGNFQIYLMAEPGYKKGVQVTHLNNVIVAGPKNYEEFWSPDSRHVALSYIDRTSQHSNHLELFRIEGGHVVPITFRTAIAALAKKQEATALWQKEARDYHEAGSSEIKWLSSTRFVLMAGEWFTSPTPRLAKAMGKFAKVQANEIPASAKPGAKTYDTVVSVFATCELDSHDTVRIVSMKPGGHSFQQ